MRKLEKGFAACSCSLRGEGLALGGGGGVSSAGNGGKSCMWLSWWVAAAEAMPRCQLVAFNETNAVFKVQLKRGSGNSMV